MCTRSILSKMKKEKKNRRTIDRLVSMLRTERYYRIQTIANRRIETKCEQYLIHFYRKVYGSSNTCTYIQGGFTSNFSEPLTSCATPKIHTNTFVPYRFERKYIENVAAASDTILNEQRSAEHTDEHQATQATISLHVAAYQAERKHTHIHILRIHKIPSLRTTHLMYYTMYIVPYLNKAHISNGIYVSS